jgi:hypothetical protein
MYPAHDHFTYPKDDEQMVVDAAVVNFMKAHLSESEFWRMVEHLFAVGIDKGAIPQEKPRRLDDNWTSVRHFWTELPAT